MFKVVPRVNKKPKKFNIVWHGFWEFLKLSGRVYQASFKLSAGFSNTVCWEFLNFFYVTSSLILLQRRILSTFCSAIKLCINKDNPLVPFLSDTPISVCQIRKSLKLSVRVEF